MYSEETTIYQRKKNLRPKLFVIQGDNIREYYLNGRQTMGRHTSDHRPDIDIPVGIVSRRHGLFATTGGITVYQDIGSSNGTLAGNTVLRSGMKTTLMSGDVLRIRARNASGSDKDVVLVYSTEYPQKSSWRKISLTGDIRSLEIGRGEGYFLQDESVSRHHATFFLAQNGWAIIDNRSKNGVFLNGRRVGEPELLHPMDVVQIANHLFVFQGDSLLIQADEPRVPAGGGGLRPATEGSFFQEAGAMGYALSGPEAAPLSGGMPVYPGGRDVIRPGRGPGIRPDAGGHMPGAAAPRPEKAVRRPAGGGRMLSIHIEERNAWNRLRKKTLLRDINLQISSGSLVLILGGSGAGKTTFMNAVMGYEPAKGSIAYGSSDIYREYEKMKYEIGYVPQQDLLRMEDVVYDTLDNAAHMRLPDSVSAAEREKAVEHALNMFGLSREKNSLVGKLSGGQRKRLSIAVEYIGNPSLFFLDEPDSGLDGIMAKELMNNLRQIADQGKIVMVISHAPDRAFDLFDKIIVLAKSSRDDSGHLVYYGSPSEACRFFGTETLEGIVGRINRKDEGGEGLADEYIRKYESGCR
jgi:ABC-type multidrug transport system ATPase subunit/pSer/pThr/pTyr-binding forkhead associated (FHA) protein